MSDYLFLVTPLGRFIRGSFTERAATDYDGNAYEDGKGPFELGFAIRKDDPASGEFLGKLYQKAVADAPNLKQKIDTEWSSGFTVGTFRFKVRDGDKPNVKGDRAGQVNPNTVGHWVLNLSTFLPIKFTYTDQYGLKLTDIMGQSVKPMTEINPDKAKIGDYGHVSISTKYNGKVDGTAGLYLSQSVIMLGAYGEAIGGGLSIDEAFAGFAASGALPVGASVAGVAGAPGLPVTAPAPVPAAAPAPVGMPGLPTAAPTSTTPHTAFLNPVNGGMPPLPGQ
jgi:hypothetical protein